jgi:hypothetical protein
MIGAQVRSMLAALPGTLEHRDPHLALTLTALMTGVVAVVLTSAEASADPQETTVQQQQDMSAEQGAQNNGNDLTRPQRTFEVRTQYRTSSGTTNRTDRESILLRANSRVDLDAGWKLAVLAQVPVVDRTTTTDNMFGIDHEFGVGDAAFQTALVRTIDERWAFGFGARLVTPTGQDNLGSGRWQIMPGFGVRRSLPDLGSDSYFVPAVRYAMSFAGDPSRRNISEPQIAPTLNISLPERWFVTFYPSYDIRINYGDPISGQTGRLFLPFDIAVGRKVTDQLQMSLEVSVPIIKDYPVYSFKTELRIVARY